jgi:hypothetical protein
MVGTRGEGRTPKWEMVAHTGCLDMQFYNIIIPILKDVMKSYFKALLVIIWRPYVVKNTFEFTQV